MRPRVGIVGGSGLYRSGLLEAEEPQEVGTPYGAPSSPLEVGRWGETAVAFLARHGPDHAIPAHRVNHRANLWALKEAGVERLVSTSSVGSLREAVEPGHFVIPDDYFAPWARATYHDEEVVHVTPGLDAGLRSGLVKAALRIGAVVHDGGVYVETLGPRLETRAEIRFLQGIGDVVGMTVASEASLARELGLAYASLCSVDNYAHGLAEEPLRYEAIQRVQRENAERLRRLLEAFLEGGA